MLLQLFKEGGRMKKIFIFVFGLVLIGMLAFFSDGNAASQKKATAKSDCISCHEKVTPGVVK